MATLLDIVLPIFGIIGAGYLAGVRGLLGAESSEALNRFVYWVALPALLFKSMAIVELGELWNPPFLAGVAGVTLAIWIVSGIAARLIFRLSPAEAVLHGLNGSYANAGYMGIPLAIAAYGEAAALPAIICAIVAVTSVGIALLPMELANQSGGSTGALIRRILWALATNPMLVAPAAGLSVAAAGLTLPIPIAAFAATLGAAAGPCALFAIGLFLVGKPFSERMGEVCAMGVTKLFIHPALTALAVIWLYPADPLWAKVAILSAALPVGAGTFVLAQATGVYVQRTSATVMVSTVLSLATISLFFLWFPAGA
ncbi:MAG: AEC family transporter [Pseudomonadota bacterium]